MPIVFVEHIAKSFGEMQAVSDVSFEIERGEIFGLASPVDWISDWDVCLYRRDAI